MQHKVTLTTEQWQAIDALAEEHVNRFAGWIAEDYQKPEKATWLASVKTRFDMWSDIRHALLQSEDLD